MYTVIDFNIILLMMLFILGTIIFSIYVFVIKKQRYSLWESLVKYSLILYITFLIKFTFMPLYFYTTSEKIFGEQPPFTQLILFRSIIDSIGVGYYHIPFGNMVMLMPLAVYLVLLDRRAYSVKYAFRFVFLVVLTIESLQLLVNIVTTIRNRIFDIDDFILNISGFMLGWLVMKLVAPYLHEWKIKTAFLQEKTVEDSLPVNTWAK